MLVRLEGGNAHYGVPAGFDFEAGGCGDGGELAVELGQVCAGASADLGLNGGTVAEPGWKRALHRGVHGEESVGDDFKTVEGFGGLRAGGDGDTALLATAPRLVVTVPSADEQQKSDVCVSEPASRLFCGPQADPLSAKTAPAEAPDRHPAAATDPPADLIERLAQANAAPRPWQRVVDDPAAALAYCRGQARRRLDRLNPLARGLLVQAEEADARRWAAMAVHASVNGQ